MPHRGRAPLLATLYFTTLIGFLPALCERSSSERALSLDAAELLRDAPLYPPLRDTLYPNTRNAETLDDTLYPQNTGQATRDAEDKVDNTLDKNVLGNDDFLVDTDTLELVDNPNELALVDNSDNPQDTLQLQQDLDNDQIQSIDKKFQPFFDTEDESIEVIQTDPETSIEDSGILVTPEETSLPDEKTNDITINENYIATERLDVKEDILDKTGRVEDLPKEARIDLQNENRDFLPKEDKDSLQKGDRVDMEQKENSIEDLLAKVEVEEKEEYNREVNISEEVLKEILGGNEEDAERTKRSAGQDWDKSKTRRIKTGDTILNIRGAVRDAIGDAGAAPGPRASSRVDAFVIRPAPVMSDEPREQRESKRERPVQPQKRERELLVEPHASARLPCDVTNVSNVRWYRDNEQMNLPTSPGADGVYRDGTTLVVGRATRHHAGRWRCTGRDGSGRAVSGEPTRVMIYEPVRSVYLAVDGRRLDAGNTWVPVRDRAELVVRCVAEGGVPPPELSWRLLALEPTLDHKPYLRANPANYSVEGVAFSRVSLTAARELHNATLQCTARQRSPTAPTAGELTAKLQIHVTYPPSFVISRWPGFGVALWAGGAAALRCDVDANPPARAAWTRHDRAPVSLAPVEEGGAGEAATLRWGALRAAHAGWYRCRARWADTDYYSIGYYLNVLASEEAPTTEAEPQPELETQKVEVPLGGNVQLHCPKGSVGCWWRRVVGNSSDNWAPAGSHHAHGVLGIKEAVYEEGGEYRCVGARAPDLQRLRELKRVTLAVTGGATATAISSESIAGGWRLTCGACGRNLRVVWVRGGRAVPAALVPDLAQHCWRTVLALPEPDEVWCVVSASNGGAVAVFPRRTPPSPAPARHAVRALHASADVTRPLAGLLATCVVMVWM